MGVACAVLIGVNKYQDSRHLHELRFAEKDCADIQSALCAEPRPTFRPEHVISLLGPHATTDAIEETLYRHVVSERSKDDLVLVYYSGHGFIATDLRLPYIASYDVNTNALSLNPNKGLRMDRLRDDVFMRSPARHVIVILDCCHSGAMTPVKPQDGRSWQGDQPLLPADYILGGRSRLAIVSCPPDYQSRESGDLQNSVFTYWLKRGLQGDASEEGSGQVTVDSLLAYCRRMLPTDYPPPGSSGEIFGRVVLIEHGQTAAARRPEPNFMHLTSHGVAPPLQFLSTPLDRYTEVIQRLVQMTGNPADSRYIEERIVAAIVEVAGADQAVVLRREEHGFSTLAGHRAQAGDAPLERRCRYALERAIDAIAQEMLAKRDYHNVMFRLDAPGEDGGWVVVGAMPSVRDRRREFLVMSGQQAGSLAEQDPFVHICISLYLATNGLTTLRSEVLEARLLDKLKALFYTHVPFEWYRRRFQLFQGRLKELTMHFQPILFLETRQLHIDGWEALVRDPHSASAPQDIFETAGIWGRRFVTQLDLHCTALAFMRYAECARRARMYRADELKDLSINVYPSTLLRESYAAELGRLMKQYPFKQHVVLEVSEKAPLPEEVRDLKAFKDHLNRYVNDFGVAFAIDDFGVGYSSVERLAYLNPKHVKIDREVLHLQTGEQAIRYVLDVTGSDRLGRNDKVVIEGFNGDSDLTLKRLYNMGIRYVQGFTIGRAGPELYRLRKEDARYLEALLVERNSLQA